MSDKPIRISGMSGNEIYCLALKGLAPGEIVVGNSVRSLGVAGSLSSFGSQLAGGEIKNMTDLINEGRHAAIGRMEEEAKKHGANGVTGVVAELKTLGGYTEFIAQGTAVHATKDPQMPFFTTAASGIESYCHIDAGYRPIHFAQGNVVYALGVGRGIMGSLKTLTRGEVKDFSQMYNEIRHTALKRLRVEAAARGANAVVDVDVDILPFGAGVEFLLTGTASHHDKLSSGQVKEEDVVTSELTGEELWNLAKMGYRPRQLVMATSIYALGVAGGIGAMFKGIQAGEIPELTHLVYEARENCLELIRQEAKSLGAERVIGNKLTILELGGGMIEVFAVGTAIVPGPDMKPATDQLISQAVIIDRDSLEAANPLQQLLAASPGAGEGGGRRQQASPLGCLIAAIIFGLIFACSIGGAIFTAATKH